MAIAGHSMGAHRGASSPRAAEPRVAALVATSGPADPYRLTRQTFRIAHLPIPDPIAYPLAWLTTRVYVKPRGHRRRASARPRRSPGTRARPAAHGDERRGRAVRAHGTTGRAAARGTAGDPDAAPVETLVVEAASTRGCTRTRAIDARSRRSSRRALGGPLTRRRGRRGRRRRRRPNGSPTARRSSMPSTDSQAGSGPSPRSPCPARHGRPARHEPPIPPPTGDVAATSGEPTSEPRPSRERRTRSGTRSPASASIRRFDGRPLEPDHLERILDAGRHAGSSKNLQRWTFIVCGTGTPARARRRVGPFAGHIAGAAVAIALVTPDPRSDRTHPLRSCSTSARPPRT